LLWVDGGRGWMGDIKEKELSVDKMLRWVDANVSGEESERSAGREILKDIANLR
jgi:hypothetical protein